ncbi:MAG TPA: hypothetical protein VLA52_14095 [Thermohalobaculum sp.]|nr:hypothetical protein [Thermohalobaculum sp.]
MNPFAKLAGKLSKAEARVESVTIRDLPEISQWMYWGSKAVRLRLIVPAEILRMHGGFAYRSGMHPFIEAIRRGQQALSAFYDAHQPQTAAEAHWSDYPTPGIGPIELPWIVREAPNTYVGERGLGAEHGIAMYGPCSAEKVKLEARRLKDLAEAIGREGYNPDKYGDIQGTFLRRGGDFRFFVRGGKHRAAVLGHLGADQIPVSLTRDWPRMVDIADIEAWPLVAQGRMTADAARAVFDCYFDMDGSRQYRMLGLV